MEVTRCNGRCCVWLTSADTDRVIPLGDDGIAILRYHLKIARLQIEMDFLASAGLKMNAYKSPQCHVGRAFERRELEVELHHLISGKIAGVCHSNVSANLLSGRDRLGRYVEVAVAELRVAQPIAEGVEWLAAEVAVGPVRHPVVFKVR